MLTPQRQSRVTVSELYEDELAYLLDGKQKTAAWLTSHWELRLSDYFGARRAREIRHTDLVAYRTHRQAFYRKTFTKATEKKMRAFDSAINSDMAALRMMFYRGKELDKLDVVPNFPQKLSGTLEREGTVTPEQFDTMLAACEPDEHQKCNRLKARVIIYAYNDHVWLLPPEPLVVNQPQSTRVDGASIVMKSNGA